MRSLSLVRYRDNDYSVPVAYGYREVVIRGYVDQVVIGCGAEGIARHRRSYEREDLVFDPLALLEKPASLSDDDRCFAAACVSDDQIAVLIDDDRSSLLVCERPCLDPVKQLS